MNPDFTQMSDAEIDAYAQECIALSGVPDGDWEQLAMAFKNAAAREAALQDPFWRDAVNQEARLRAIEEAGIVLEPDDPAPTPEESNG
ncbi:hypothetical protein SEA_MACGULLY_57 [Rhodococcus phage MacGully]|nr:hypothetical protein SEA_MACGULLY_57 [Rhodococcus phage MacGully]